MKLFISVIITIIFCSCGTSRNGTLNYYHVEPFKEQEIMFYLKNDSTFIFRDKIGCNQFEFAGRYKKVGDNNKTNYFVLNSVKQNILSKYTSESVFFIQNDDSALVINADRISIHGQIFIATSRENINLQKIRYKKLKNYYTEWLGEKGFLETFGNGSKKEAKKRLLDCKLPDINIR